MRIKKWGGRHVICVAMGTDAAREGCTIAFSQLSRWYSVFLVRSGSIPDYRPDWVDTSNDINVYVDLL